jgi:hypothetical protein
MPLIRTRPPAIAVLLAGMALCLAAPGCAGRPIIRNSVNADVGLLAYPVQQNTGGYLSDISTGTGGFIGFGPEFSAPAVPVTARVALEAGYRRRPTVARDVFRGTTVDGNYLTVGPTATAIFIPGGFVSPYAGVGAGWSRARLSGVYEGQDAGGTDSTFFTQGLGGVLIGPDRIKLDLGIRFIHSPHDFEVISPRSGELAFTAGVLIRL